MSKALIQKHNFEIAKGNIEKFSKNLPSNPSFNRVEVDGGLFGWGDHKVTGSEMNKFIGIVQDKLISVNSSLRAIMGEFKEVYNAFDFLDGEYISGIIGSVESAEEASKQALKAQEDIKNTVENLKKTVVGLMDLKITVERIEKVVNASNISSFDEITNELDNEYKIKQIPSLVNNISALQTNLAGLHQQVEDFIVKVKQATERINNDIAVLQQYRTMLESHEHLSDIDTIWNNVEGYKINLTSLHQQVDEFIEKVNQATERINNDITVMQQYHSTLESYEHLADIDAIWNDVEGHKTDLASLHQQMESFIKEVHSSENEIKETIQKMSESNTSAYLLYEKRIKIAYCIGGSALGLLVVNFILQILGVL
ncbi:hypothetical protein [Bacteroides sp. 224]|uniref:hypothetical protein n=1 Tax=Bacteroides sp. 224 TaxID=2302936 RepID=UPI0013D4F4EA|nr:hypothetical protein [Bacteroides sp. 224]NDV63803.1 hypothetical protein [Bacteroides sp. 224]